jgi:2-C-methyl-D-erythritol 4-phosphate cytidylyltransferase
MGLEIPKQYLVITGMSLLEHVLSRLCRHPSIEEVVVAVRDDDPWWPSVKVAGEIPPLRVSGGAERMHSVLNGLDALVGKADQNDWVLVHDAARPCIRRQDIDRLIDELDGHPVGGLLALPVGDTMKRSTPDGDVQDTVVRDNLWHAMTPQMFRYGLLRAALQKVVESGSQVTDEAQAIELAGGVPRIVEGRADNIKVTRLQDMVLAEMFIRQQAMEPSPG